MRSLIAAIMVTFTVMAFQNCAKNGLDSNSLALRIGQKSTVKFEPEADQQYIHPSESKSILFGAENTDGSQYRVHLESGRIDLVLEGNQSGKTDVACLSPNEILELKNILSTSNLCEGEKPNSNSGMIACSMIYGFPYAALEFEHDTINLGERISGCETGPDLCEHHSGMLKGFLSAIRGKLNEKSCNL